MYLYSAAVVEDLYLATLSDATLHQAKLVGSLLPWELRGTALDASCAALAPSVSARVSVIAPDGTVLGDSEAVSATLENHRDRPEVRSALRGGEGQAVRLSTSIKRRLFYRAWRQREERLPNGRERVIRLAVPMETIEQAHSRIRAAILGGACGAALAALVPALLVYRRLQRRMSRLGDFANAVARGEEPRELVPERQDEIGRLERDLGIMASTLRAQLQVAAGEQRKLSAVLQSMVEGVVVVDRSATVQLANRCAEQLLGKTPNETIVDKPLIAVCRDPDLQELVRNVMRAETEQPLMCETLIGELRLQVTATPVRQLRGEPQLFILVFHDITALKRLEATRRDFVANVSHELRTPLTAIRGYAETLRAGAVNDKAVAQKFSGVIERHAERLSRLVDDLLTISDLELGHAEIRRLPVALARVVEAAIDVLRDKAEQGELRIERGIPPDLPAVYADPDRLEQVFVNLIDNAIKYTPAGGKVTISGAPVPQPEVELALASRGAGKPYSNGSGGVGWVVVTVADNGVGIPSADLPRLTERFYRVDKARSRELGGTGLGLAIVKHILQAHGGGLRIESQLGHGTSVRIYLPIAGGDARA